MSAVVASTPVLSNGTRRHASHRSGEQASSKPTLFLVTAHHDFKPTDPDQLPFGKGDVLEIVRVDAATGWAAARRPGSSKIGWIPRSFVTTMKEPATTAVKTVDISIRLAQPRQPNPKTGATDVSEIRPRGPNFPHQSASKPTASSPQQSSALPANVTSSTLTSASPRPPPPPQTLRLHTNLTTVGSEPPSPLSDADALMYFSPSTFTPSSRTSRKASAWRTQPSTAHPFAVGLEWAAPEEKPKPQGLDLPAPEDIFGPLPSIDRSASRTRSASVDARAGGSRTRQRSRSNAATSRAISVLPNRLGDIVEGALSVRSRSTSTSNDSQISATTSSSSSNLANRDSPSLMAVDAASSSGSSSRRERSDSTQNHPVTLSQLIDALLKEHSKSTSCDDISFCSIFFTTFHTFVTPEALFDRLKYHYTRTATIDSRQGNVVLVQVVNALRCWITHQALSQESGPVATAVSRFLLDVSSPPAAATVAKNALLALQLAPPPGLEPPVTAAKTTKYQGVDEFFKIPASVVAEHLCLYEHRIYSRILPTDCVIYAKSQSAQETARIQRFCATSDRIASLVKHSVLVEPLAKRVSAIEYWVKVAQRCLALFNAASGCAIIAALSSADISRLKRTWNSVSSSTNQTLKSAKRFIDPQANHRAMRTFLRDADGPCVPFIGMFLRDLVHLHESMPESPESSSEPDISEPLINWNKRRRLAVTVWMILQHQKESYVFSEDRVVAELLTSELDRSNQLNAQVFYERSEALRQTEGIV